jgi:hypothetical protein
VLPDPTIVSLPPNQLGPFFDEAVRQSQLLRLRGPLKQELDQGSVEVSIDSTPALAKHVTLHVRLVSHYQHLPTDVALKGVSVRDGGRMLRATLAGGPRTVHLLPGATETVQVDATLPVPDEGFQVPEEHEAQQVNVVLDAASTAQPADLINRLFKFKTTKPVAQADPLTLRRTVDWPIWLVAAVVLGALLAVAALIAFLRWLVVAPQLVGVLEPVGEGGEGRKPVRLSGKRMTIDYKRLPEAGAAVIEVFTRPRQRNRVFAVMKKPDFEVQARHHRWERITGERRLESAETYRIGGARVRWWRKAKRG